MKVEVKKLDGIKRVLKVEVHGDSFFKERDKAYLTISKDLKTPGFRPGTAPIDVLMKHHSSVLTERFLDEALPKYYQEALAAEKIVPAGYPRIYDVEMGLSGLTFFVELETRPEFELKVQQYRGMKIDEPMPVVKDDEVQKVLDNLKSQIAKVMARDVSEPEIAGWAGYAGTADLRAALSSEIMTEKLRVRRDKIYGHLIEQLLKTFKLDIPQSAVERQHHELVEREMYALKMRGVGDDDVEKYRKDIEEKLKPEAQDQVKLFYILEAIAAKENIKSDKNVSETVLGYIMSQAEYK